ncbi:LANO_0F03950g1_1 [Lachancea nothofagi CBS 11611]|uniref:RNA polymerase II subunit B1 CTD phosphatase RPAP2 homolog n=1 Tax=Lachancea nothofagi CBS 11611 TaxID=1266666 RepID=A0A1G4K7F4_9SACH|nr:LANO_0F03950g1_1 [Lachancea nothofagi CBS 11611]
MTSIEDIKRLVLKPYQNHRQLSIKEADTISLEILDLLSQSDCKDTATLKYLANFLTLETYHDLVEERNLNKKCGYPACDRSQNRVRDPYGRNAMATQFLQQNNPYAYLSHYCSKFHYRCSQFYEVQLTDDALFVRIGVHLDDEVKSNAPKLQDISLLEEIIQGEELKQQDLISLVSGIGQLQISQNGDDDAKQELEKDLSDWLSRINIVENESPHPMGDFFNERSR